VRTPFERALRRLASSIRRRRLELELTQEDVAYQAGISARHYQLLESGQGNPTFRTLTEVARVLEKPISAFLRDV